MPEVNLLLLTPVGPGLVDRPPTTDRPSPYLLCIEGGVTVNGQRLGRHDACEITDGEGAVEITL